MQNGPKYSTTLSSPSPCASQPGPSSECTGSASLGSSPPHTQIRSAAITPRVRDLIPSANALGTGYPRIKSEAGGTLIWVILVSLFSSMSMFYFSGKMDRFEAHRTSIRANLFIQESVTNFNVLGLQCPGGVIRISRGSCSAKNGLKLSLPQIRRLISLNNIGSSANGITVAPQTGLKMFGAADIFVTRVQCYKQGNPELQTPDFFKPCVALRGITSVSLVGASLLRGTPEEYLNDVTTIESRIFPEISKKMDETRGRMSSLQVQMDSLRRSLDSLQNSCARHVPTEESPFCGEAGSIASVSGEMANISSHLNQESVKLQNYQAMIAFLQTTTVGKGSLISNSQLADIQEKGGLMRIILQHGLEDAGRKALAMLPQAAQDRRETKAPPIEADLFAFGMLEIEPYCENDDGKPSLRLRARLISSGPRYGKLGSELTLRKKMLTEVLQKLGQNGTGGFTAMPANFVPSSCDLKEEDDPPTFGKANWTADFLSNGT